MGKITAIYELGDNKEATGTVYHYCCPEHADLHTQAEGLYAPRYGRGQPDLAGIDKNERCCHCGASLFPKAADDPSTPPHKFTILYWDERGVKNITKDLGEGPWDSYEEALAFAQAEVHAWDAIAVCGEDGRTRGVGEGPASKLTS